MRQRSLRPTDLYVVIKGTQVKQPVWVWTIIWLAIWTAGLGFLHQQMHGSLSAWHLTLVLFLAVNLLITFQEISLYLCIDQLEARYQERQNRQPGEARPRRKSFFLAPASFGELLTPALWSNVWAEYAKYDPSYADRKSFGFAIDVGNGFSTLIPSLLFLFGMTLEIFSPLVLGILGLLLFYQKFYCTGLYFFTYLFNRRYEGHSRAAVWSVVGGSNIIWMIFPAIGMYVCYQLIVERSFDILR